MRTALPPWVQGIQAISDTAALCRLLRNRHPEDPRFLPAGSGSHLGRGGAPSEPVVLLEMSGLRRVVDYPWSDLTVTVEAGITMAELRDLLDGHGQWLPILGAGAMDSTLGGVIGADRRGPLAGTFGSLRDYLIGVGFVTGDGKEVEAGGRVVKNVAGYDLMKLLTGSLGALAVVTEVTLKVLPKPAAWGGVEMEAPTGNRLTEAVRAVAADLSPAGLWLSRSALQNTRLTAIFTGPAPRVAFQVDATRERWGESARPLEEQAVFASLGRWENLAVPRTKPVVWGGCLPGWWLEAEAVREDLTGTWWSDILRGHFWWNPDKPLSTKLLRRFRKVLNQGEGHANLDQPPGESPSADVWGWDGNGERDLWMRIKNGLDPTGAFARGRLPGGV